MLTGIRFDDLGEVFARIEENQEKKDAGGTHALAANLRSKGGGQGRRGGGAQGGKGNPGGRGKRGQGRHQQQQWVQQPHGSNTTSNSSINSGHPERTLIGLNQDVPDFVAASLNAFTLNVGQMLSFDEFDDEAESENWLFRVLVGSLRGLVISIRPDISNTVRFVARFCSSPKVVQWKRCSVFLRTLMVL